MIKLYLIELHNSSSKSSSSGLLSPSDNTLYYNEKAAITSGCYLKIFNTPFCQCARRLSILKITYVDDSNKRHTIWRTAHTKGVLGINNDCIGLPFDAIWELNATKAIRTKTVKVDVKRGNWLPFFLFHPNHAARIATWIGLLSLMFTIIGVALSVCFFVLGSRIINHFFVYSKRPNNFT